MLSQGRCLSLPNSTSLILPKVAKISWRWSLFTFLVSRPMWIFVGGGVGDLFLPPLLLLALPPDLDLALPPDLLLALPPDLLLFLSTEPFLGEGDLFLGGGEGETFFLGEGDSLTAGLAFSSFFSSAFLAPPFALESFLLFLLFFLESLSLLESEEEELESELESELELELELEAFRFFLSFSFLSLLRAFLSSPLLSELLSRDFFLPLSLSSFLSSAAPAPGAMLLR